MKNENINNINNNNSNITVTQQTRRQQTPYVPQVITSGLIVFAVSGVRSQPLKVIICFSRLGSNTLISQCFIENFYATITTNQQQRRIKRPNSFQLRGVRPQHSHQGT